MINPEFSDQFDVFYNNITSNQAPGLDEYEKSVFLTRAQNEVLISYFDPRLNKVQEGFDDSQRRQIDFSMVTKVHPEDNITEAARFDPRANSKSVSIPTDVLVVVNERLTVSRDGKDVYLTVIPIHYSEYDRLMSKPYKRPLKYQAWRVFSGDGDSIHSDLVVGPNDTIEKYELRYISRPTPIILSSLDGLTIEGKEGPLECVLDPILHPVILQRAVELAKASYAGDLSSQLALGQSSQTEMGIVTSSK